MDLIKRLLVHILASIAAIQGFSWVFGISDQVTNWLKSNQELTIIALLIYTFVFYIGYDANLRLQKLKYHKKMSGVPLRLPRKPKEKKNRSK